MQDFFVATTKVIARCGEERYNCKTIHGFAMAKMLFVTVKMFAKVKAIAHHSEEKVA